MMKPMYKQLLGFLAISVGLRILTFFRSVIDHDESTYIVIGDAILQGARYWIDVTDVKPVGIFWLYAGFLGVLGHSIAAMRLMAAVFLGLTAFFVVKNQAGYGQYAKCGLWGGSGFSGPEFHLYLLWDQSQYGDVFHFFHHARFLDSPAQY
jgi:hypothetical protein